MHPPGGTSSPWTPMLAFDRWLWRFAMLFYSCLSHLMTKDFVLHDFSILQIENAVGLHGKCFIMRDEKKGLFLAAVGFLEQSDNFLASLAVEIARPVERPSDGNPLLLSAGELARKVIPAVGQTEMLNDGIQTFPVQFTSVEQMRQGDVFLYVEYRHEVVELIHQADLTVSARACPCRR